MATDTTYNVSLVTSGEIVASLKDADEVLIYPKTVAQAVTVMQAGYSDGSTTQTLAERLAALDETDSALSAAIDSGDASLSDTAAELQALEEDLDDIGEIENLQTSLTTNSIASIYATGTTSVHATFYSHYTKPVEVSSVSLKSAVQTLAAYCHKHTASSSSGTLSGSCSSYCSCDCNDCCDCRGE